MRHADLRREATAVIAKPASALLYDTVVWYLVWVCGRVGVCLVVGPAMRWVQKTCKTFSTEFFDWFYGYIESKKLALSNWIPHSATPVEKKKLIFDCVRKPDSGFSRKRPFSTDKSDC